MKSRICLPAILLAAATSVYAQPTGQRNVDDSDAEVDVGGPEANSMLKIHLNEVVGVIVTKSPDLVRARFDRTIARDQAEAERKGQAWVATLSANYSRNGVADHVDVAPNSVVAQDTRSGTLGIGRNLPTGGTLSFEVGGALQNSEYDILGFTAKGTGSGMPPAPVPDEEVSTVSSHTSVTFKQPLSRGLGSVALAGERKADLAATEATIKAQLQAEDTLKDVISSYWELAYSNWELDVRMQGLDMAQKQETLTHDQIRAGTASPTAVSQVESEIFQRQEALLKSQVDVESKSMDLLRKSGLALERRQTLLRPAEAMEIGDDEFDIDEVLARAKVANRKLATLQIERKSAEVDVEVAQDLTKPQVDLTLTGALIGTGADTSDALAGIGNGDGYQVVAGLNVSWEISGAAKKGRDAAVMKKNRLEIDRIDAERQIETQTVLAVKQVNAARKRVDWAKKAVNASNDNVRSERAQFQAGKTTAYSVLQRQTDAINARLSLGRAVTDYHIAVATLQYLSGTLLDQYGIDVKPHEHR